MSFQATFVCAVKSDDLNQVESLLLEGVDPNFVYPIFRTPLIYAIENVSIPMIELLVRHGAFLNRIEDSYNPLQMAAGLKSPQKSDVIFTLLTLGADPTDSDCSLAWFAKDDSLRVLDALLANYSFSYDMLLRAQNMATRLGQLKAVDLMGRHPDLADFGEPCRIY